MAPDLVLWRMDWPSRKDEGRRVAAVMDDGRSVAGRLRIETFVPGCGEPTPVFLVAGRTPLAEAARWRYL